MAKDNIWPIRPLALGRMNYLSARSHKGTQRAAMMYSFFASCQKLGVNPWVWLKDVLERIPDQSPDELDCLLLRKWLKLGA